MLKKLLGAGVILALVATVLVGVGASTASAQSMSLCQTVDALILAGVIAPDKVDAAKAAAGCTATAPASASYTFTRSLTLGSTGADVTALQNFLISNGNSIPAGATGYFGAQTQAALAAYQAAKGIMPSVGYFGPLTMASVNANTVVVAPTVTGCEGGAAFNSLTGAACGAVSTVPGCAVGALFSSTTGASCTGGTTGGITTTGQEGTISVTSSATGLVSTAYEGDEEVAILGFKVKAMNSDVSVQRVDLNFATTTTVIQSKIYKTLYVVDEDGNILGSADTSEAYKDSAAATANEYALSITGLNYVIEEGETKTFKILADVYGTVDSGRIASYTVRLSANGVRAVDGAGIDQYAGGITITRTVSVAKSLASTATLTLSTYSGTPTANSYIAADGTNDNELDDATLLKFSLKAKKDDVLVTDLVIAAATSTGDATLQTVYLYEGSTELDSTTLAANGTATFSDVDIDIAEDETKTFTVKADIRNAGAAVTTWSATTTSAYITAENSEGDPVTVSGSATGNAQSFLNTGAEVTLVSKSIGTQSSSDNGSGFATTTQSYVFNVNIKAVGGEVVVGHSASTTPAFNVGTTTMANFYKGSALDGMVGGAGQATSTVAYFAPDSGVTENANGDFVIADGGDATFEVTYSLVVSTYDAGSWSVGIKGVKVSNVLTSFMDGLSAWRSAGVQLP